MSVGAADGQHPPAGERRPGWRAGWVSRWLPVLGWMALIFVLSAQPGLRVSDDATVDGPARSVAHVVMFGVLGGLLYRALGPSVRSDARTAMAAFALATLYGVSDELHQALVPDRTGQVDDVLLDAVGAAMGVAIAAIATRAMSGSRAASGLGRKGGGPPGRP